MKLGDLVRVYATCESECEKSGMRVSGEALMELADQIDQEHERRMERCQRETIRATMRYLRGVMGDYEKGIKRDRPSKVVPKPGYVFLSEDGVETTHRCPKCGKDITNDDNYCAGCGGRVVWKEKR